MDIFIDEHTTREQLEEIIVCGEASLYRLFDEQRLLNAGYTAEELYEIIRGWIEASDECASA
jgi:hypothetical protein